MDEFDIPIFKKSYELYRNIYILRPSIPKQDKHTLWQRIENANLDNIEGILQASELYKHNKLPTLEKVSVRLNLLRFLIRLAKDIKIIDNNKYTPLQQQVDEIGRMLGGWIRSLKSE